MGGVYNMKKLWIVLGVILLAAVAWGLTTWTVSDGVVGYDSGYFVGTFYKEAKTGNVYKVVSITKDTIWIAPFEYGELVK